jgi:hypothetical protein
VWVYRLGRRLLVEKEDWELQTTCSSLLPLLTLYFLHRWVIKRIVYVDPDCEVSHIFYFYGAHPLVLDTVYLASMLSLSDLFEADDSGQLHYGVNGTTQRQYNLAQ